MSSLDRPVFKNRLLELLSPSDLARLAPHLSPTSHKLDDRLYEVDRPMDYVYFPMSCVVSALTIMKDGSAIEVATVGPEGMVGQPIMLGHTTSVNRVIIQIAGEALRLSSAILISAARESPSLGDLLDRYNRAYHFQVSQSVACNGLHKIKRRCCRWLLMSRDRVRSDEISLTHEYLGYMLGVRRASVTDVLAPLQAAGLLKSQRGVITLLDPEAIEDRACECYRTVRDHYEKLLGGS